MKICAGIVLYNPDIIRLKENIDSILTQVDCVVLTDNGSENINEIILLVEKYSREKLSIVRNNKNEGIARALNQILQYAKSNDFSWFLTLDQDTISNEGLIECYLKYINDNIGQLSCNIIDRNIGTIDEVKDYKGKNTVEIDFCITSGCLNNTRALVEVGGYTDRLFIDGVDLDVSCKLRKAEYKILNVNFNGILHELGQGEIRSLFGINIVLAHHVPWRNYYARRNIIYVARKYYHGFTKVKMILKQVFYGIGAILLENEKKDRLRQNFKGISDGFKMSL